MTLNKVDFCLSTPLEAFVVVLFIFDSLGRGGEEIGKGVAGLQREREALERCVLDMAGKTTALDR